MNKTIINSLIVGMCTGMLAACGGGSSNTNSNANQLANGEACAAAWVSTTVYAGAGTKVSRSGRNYTNNWWTQGQDPLTSSGGAGSGQPWTAGFTCGGTPTPTPTPTGDGSTWKGHRWTITNGGMAGVAPGSPSNVFVDSNGYLHLKITKTGSSYTAAEMFSNDRMGFGTYQWQIQGAIDNMDKSTVLGLFPYGPAAGIGIDGENEIDIEFSKWDNTCGGCNADFTYYPSTGNMGLGAVEDNFTFSLHGGTLTTARMEWRSNKIIGTIMSGLQPMGVTANVIRTFTLAPSDTRKIPQVPLPLGMNLWSFQSTSATNQEVIIRDFQYKP